MPDHRSRADDRPGGTWRADDRPGGTRRAATVDGVPPADGGFEAAIFDMDGLLVDSEPLWHEAEVDVLGALGVPLAAQASRLTKGMFVREVTRYWFDRHPWSGPGTDEVADAVVDAVTALVVAKGRLQPGVGRAIGLCRAHGLRMAVASSSHYRLIDVVLDHFDLRRWFEVVHSAEEEDLGKPHPAVFLTAAGKLGVAPDRCLVWEDAPAGVLAAKAARMTCVAVPEAAERHRRDVAIADAVLGSLEEVDEVMWERLVRARQTAGAAGGGPVPAGSGPPAATI